MNKKQTDLITKMDLGQFTSLLRVPTEGISFYERMPNSLSTRNPLDPEQEPEIVRLEEIGPPKSSWPEFDFNESQNQEIKSVVESWRSKKNTNEILENLDGMGPWFVASSKGTQRQFAPLLVPNLHRKFGGLIEGTQKSVLNFVNDFGLLGHDQDIWEWLPNTVGAFGKRESLRKWSQETLKMHRLIETWDFVRSRDIKNLKRFVIWKGPESVCWNSTNPTNFKQGGEFVVLAQKNGNMNPQLLEIWKTYDVVEPAMYYLCLKINEALKNHVSPAIMPLRRSEIHMVPDCLLSAMYVLLALEVSGKISNPPRICKGCGTSFVPTRKNNYYCSKECLKRSWWRTNKSTKHDLDQNNEA